MIPRKPSGKPSSVKLYCRLQHQYDLHPACDMCICIDDDTHKCGLKTDEHECRENRLVLFAKNSHNTIGGDLLRLRPPGYDPVKTDHICEHVDLNEPCLEKHLCPYPHTDVEKDLWKQDYSGDISIARLVRDLHESALQFSVEVERLMKRFNGTFRLICAACYQESSEIFTKRHHVPECRGPCSHHWSDKKLVFETALDNRLIHCDNFDIHQQVSKEEQELVRCLKLLMQLMNDLDLTVDDIAEEAARLRQADTVKSSMFLALRNATCVENKHKLCHPEFDDDDTTGTNFSLAKTDEDIFDDDADDLLNDAAFDEDTGDSKHQHSTKPHVIGNYYEVLTEEETQDNSEVIYRCGIIKLLGAFKGICKIVGGEMDGREVDLRGRVNCGPAFDGDEVRVKIYKKNTEEDCNTANSVQLFGTVVSVVKRNIHRTARTFVCKVGLHRDNQMTPLCGTAPKFHIIDSCLVRKYGQMKRDYVAVYNSDLTLRRVVKLDPRRRREMLFIVKYLKWENKHQYPLGYVCRVLHERCTIKDSQKILNLMYELPFHKDTALEITGDKFEDERSARREDMCKLLTVSIDHPFTKDIDDALSLEEVDGKFVVWTHVADVTHYVREDDCNDKKAQSRILTFCSSFPRQTCHMLPAELAVSICSLLEQKRRRALSVRFEFTVEGEVLSSTGPLLSWIRNDKQLSYLDVEKIIDGSPNVLNCDNKDAIEHLLLSLHKLATVLRKQRMNEGSHYYEYYREHCFSHEGVEDPFDFDQNHDAHRLVEEFMIRTNQCVGRMLRQKFPNCTPFLVQNEPNDKLKEIWKMDHGFVIPFSFYLKQHQEVLGISRENCAVTPLVMVQNCWNALKDAVVEGNMKKVRTVIGSEQLHPLHIIALSSWFGIQEPKQYICDDSNGMRDMSHFSLQTCDYVHFTSPLRRYMDIIVHRLVKVQVTGVEQLPYTQDEVEGLCEKMNALKSRKRSYDHWKGLQEMAGMLLKRPVYLPCYVKSFNDLSIDLVSPYFQTDSPLACRLTYNEMTVHDNPLTSNQSGRKVTLNWIKRYYDTRESQTPHARSDSDTTYVLDFGKFGTTVYPHVWSSMHEAVNGQTENLLARVSEAVRTSNPILQQQQPCGAEEVTSEMAESRLLVRHLIKFSCDITRGTVMSVQFGAKIINGSLQPVIKLVNLTHDKDICIEHQRDPVDMFASVATEKVKNMYDTIEEYQNIWQPVLAMEAATQAVRNNEAVVCSSVPVRFHKRNGIISGKLELDKGFCAKRYIKLYRVSDEETHDYMCIRYFLKNSKYAKSFSRNVWVAHAMVCSCKVHGNVIQLTVKCKGSHDDAPRELFNRARDPKMCTVEFLQRTLPDK